MSRSNLGHLRTEKSPDETRREIDDCFRKWGIDEYRVPRDGKGEWGEAKLIFWVNDQKQELDCRRFDYYRDNLRALYLILESLRKAQERGILSELARAAIAMLPPGPAAKRPAHIVLGVAADSPVEIAEAAYRILARQRHPDVGGTEAAMTELNEAMEEFRRKAAAPA